MHYIMSNLDYKVPSEDFRDVVQDVDNANDKEKYSEILVGMLAVLSGVVNITLFPKKQ